MNGTNRNYDKDISKIIQTFINAWVISWLNISWWSIQPWYWFVQLTRSSWDVFLSLIEVTSAIAVDVTWTKKVWIEVSQSKIDDWSSNAVDWTWIASVQTGASYPAWNFIKIAWIVSWVVTDEREVRTIKYSAMKELTDWIASQNFTTQTYVDAQVASAIVTAWAIEAIIEKDSYVLWEQCIINDNLFPEKWPTFAEAVTVQNIGDVTANTRVILYDFWSWISSNTKKLSLRKFVSPSVNLSVRLETIDWSWNPTGTLVNANANSVVTSASLTTSLVDTTVTFWGNFIIPKWQKYAVVLNAVWDVVNWTNYFWVWCVLKNTTTQQAKRWNWSSYSTIINNITDNAWWLTTTASSTSSDWQRILVNKNIFITQLVKVSACTATRARIFLNWWWLLATATFSWDIATLSTPLYAWVWTSLRVEYDNNWSTYNSRNSTPGAWIFPAWTNVSYIIWSVNQWDISNINYNIASIVSYEDIYTFPYTSSNLCLSTVLSKADARYSYKLPIDFTRIANEAKNAWENVSVARLWLKRWFSWISNVPYYASNTPWLISATPGNNIYMIWEWIDTSVIDIWSCISNAYTIASWSIWASWSIDSLWILARTDMVISIDCFRSSWASWSITVTLYEWLTSSPTTIVAQSLSYDSSIWVVNTRYQSYTIKKWTYYRYVISWNANLWSWTYSITAKQM